MKRSLLTRGFTIAVTVASLVGSLAVSADATVRASSNGEISDPTGDALGPRSVPVQEPRADLTGAKAVVHGDGRIELTASVAQPTDPATDPGWAEGHSYVMWGLDTTADGTADFLVWMASGPPLAAAVFTNQLDTVDACNPVPDYTPARYSVTVPGSCIGSPATFGWNAVVSYDADHNDEGTGAIDSLLGPQQVTLTPGTKSDPTGDVVSQQGANDPRADITAATIEYKPGRIDLTATLDQPTDPRLDPNWATGSTELGWYLDTDGNDEPEYVAALGAAPDLTVTVYDMKGGNSPIVCTALATYTPARYAVTLDPACIGSPDRLWWGVGTLYTEDGQGAADLAPDLTMAGPVTIATADPGAQPAGVGQSGYWMITSRGEVFAFGDARPLGGDQPCCGAQRVDIEPTRSGNGYWILDASGAVVPKGDAQGLGDATGQLQPGERAAALSATPTGDGYWIFTDRGRVLPFGTAAHLGDMAGTPLKGAILDSVATPTGKGYWMVGSDGGIFSFGDAVFSGSTGNMTLNKPVMSMAADPDGQGYWLVASDGGIFAFDAPFYGSMGGTKLNKPISGIVPGDAGYLMVGEDGGIFAFGKVAFNGSLGGKPPADPVVAVALAP
jgi:hypothetical protein